VLATAPSVVDVYFTEDLFQTVNTYLNVVNASNVDVDNNDEAIDSGNLMHMSITLHAGLPDGLYTVQWGSTSADDGDTDEGTFQFRIGPPSVGGISTDAVSHGSNGLGTSGSVPVIASMLVVMVAGGGAWFVRRRLRREA